MLVQVYMGFSKEFIEYDKVIFGKTIHKRKEISDYSYTFNHYVICDEKEAEEKVKERFNDFCNIILMKYKKYCKNIKLDANYWYRIENLHEMRIKELYEILTPEQFKQEFGYLMSSQC